MYYEDAITKSNDSVPSKIFLDPYSVADGNLWTTNFEERNFGKGNVRTCAAARGRCLVWEKLKEKETDPEKIKRCKYIEQPIGRFTPALKPACSRDKGPDPYGTFKHESWVIADQGYYAGRPIPGDQRGLKVSNTRPDWNTYSLAQGRLGNADRIRVSRIGRKETSLSRGQRPLGIYSTK